MITRRFTDRAGGVSVGKYESFNLGLHVGDDPVAVASNRLALEKVSAPLAFMNQIHGDTVFLVEGPSKSVLTADALVTAESGIALAVLVADCVPVLLWDEDSSIVGAVHVGRRGLVNNITHKALAVMRELGADNIKAEFGPSICGKCYEVKVDIFESVCDLFPAAKSAESEFEFALDLPGALEAGLLREGVGVTRSDICTRESYSHFSYRRDGVTGRTAGIIWS